MFQQLRNIDSAFRHIKVFSLVLILAVSLICCYTVFRSFAYAEAADQRIYVIIDGKAWQAIASTKKENIPVSARTHIKSFHQLFFTLVPDETAIQENMKKAFYLGDKSIKDQYDDLKESGYFSQIVSANISQELIIDSIKVNTNSRPYYFRFYGKERIERPTSVIMRNLITEGWLRDLQLRTDNNPEGFLIERWAVIQNNDISVQKK